MTFRFAAAVLIMLLLVVANTAVLIKDYERRLAASYNTALKTERQQLQERKTYSSGDFGRWAPAKSTEYLQCRIG